MKNCELIYDINAIKFIQKYKTQSCLKETPSNSRVYVKIEFISRYFLTTIISSYLSIDACFMCC